MVAFEFDGEKYLQASKHQKEWGHRLISELEFNGNEAILDLGCGDGLLTERLSSLVPNGKVVGLDASCGMIESAKRRAGNNLGFVCMDINDLNFVGEFDLIFSNAALHWVKDHESLLKNSLAALKKTGLIRWNFAGDGNCSNFSATVKTVMNDDAYKDYFVNFEWPWFMPTKTEYEKILAKAGFGKTRVEFENADRCFTDSDEMINWMDQPCLVPFIRHLPDKIKDDFRAAVVCEMIRVARQPDGGCFETFRRIDVRAVK
jgi:trans-aconitate methyltransferase